MIVTTGVLWELVTSRVVGGVRIRGLYVGLRWPKRGCLPTRISPIDGIVCILPRDGRKLRNQGLWVVSRCGSGDQSPVAGERDRPRFLGHVIQEGGV